MRPSRCHRHTSTALAPRQCAFRCALRASARAAPAPSDAAVSSGWAAEGTDGFDRLHNLGRAQNYNINVDHGQSADFIDTRFTGNFLGKKSDIASGELRYKNEFRTYNNIVGDYYIAQRFLHRVAMHIAKNYLCHKMPGVKVPLILGIWGPKGTGKTFQTELSFKKMKAQPVIMSAGELESGTAGGPGYLLRKRYRAAADMSKARGVLSCLMVNDIDAGLGRFEATGATVNNQICCSTLMNICDTPERVSLGLDELWGKKTGNKRIPIIVTGNDFSTLWAPLIRDGRMDKFYWQPNMEEMSHMVYQMYKDDGITFENVQMMLQRFGNQSLDFFGAIRSSTFDRQILAWIRKEVAVTDLSEDCNLSGIRERLLHQDDLPAFVPDQLTLDGLVEQGDRLVHEHEMVNSLKLSDVYMNKGNPDGKVVAPMIGLAM